MNKTILMLLTVVVVLASSSVARAQDVHGKFRIYYTPSSSVLQAQVLTGAPEFKNDGRYWGGIGETSLVGRVGVEGSFTFGASTDLPGGLAFGTPTFNPTTDEVARIFDASGTYTLFRGGKPQGQLIDVTLGYFYLWADPAISRPNSYGGPAVGLRGNYDFSNGLGLHYKVGFVPTYFVHGNVAGALDSKDIWLYRAGADWSVHKHFGVSAGYQGFRLTGRITFAPADAVVTLKGFYFGGLVKW